MAEKVCLERYLREGKKTKRQKSDEEAIKCLADRTPRGKKLNKKSVLGMKEC